MCPEGDHPQEAKQKMFLTVKMHGGLIVHDELSVWRFERTRLPVQFGSMVMLRKSRDV